MRDGCGTTHVAVRSSQRPSSQDKLEERAVNRGRPPAHRRATVLRQRIIQLIRLPLETMRASQEETLFPRRAQVDSEKFWTQRMKMAVQHRRPRRPANSRDG